MHKLNYTLTTLSPIVISKNSGDPNMVATEDYIPGSVILGAFAMEYIKRNKMNTPAHTDETFSDWFLRGKILFHNCYVSSPENDSPIYPLPICLQEEKTSSGNGKTIALHNLFNYDDDELQDKTFTYRARYGNLDCKRFYHLRKSLGFHHERDYQKGSSKKGIIFNYEQIDADQVFRGVIASSQREDLDSFRNFFDKEIYLKIGKSRGTQYGEVVITFDSKIEAFKRKIPKDSQELILFFTSNAILINENGLSTVDSKTIEDYLGEGLKVGKAFLRQEEVEGYSAIWKTKKPLFNALSAGSCLKLKEIEKEALERLDQMQATGIGERTNEGFGQFQVMPTDIANSKTITISENETEYLKPEGDIPEAVLEIVKDIITKNLISETKKIAINDCKEFHEKSSQSITKSLMSRLESMVYTTGKPDISKLRKPARDQLESIHNDQQTLKDLIEGGISLTNIYTNTEKLSKEINYDPTAAKDLTELLMREYWLTFFAFMRKKLKEGGTGK